MPWLRAVEETRIEGGRELAMTAQVAQRAQAEARGGPARDGERVGVVEAERLADDQPPLGHVETSDFRRVVVRAQHRRYVA